MARLKDEYGVEATYEAVDLATARWISSDDRKELDTFTRKMMANLYTDAEGHLTYLAQSQWHLGYTMEQWPAIRFAKTKEHN